MFHHHNCCCCFYLFCFFALLRLTGNDAIHILTEKKEQVLRVQLLSFDGEEAHAVYSNFHVGDEDSEYKLTVSGYNGTAGRHISYMHSVADQLCLTFLVTYLQGKWLITFANS